VTSVVIFDATFVRKLFGKNVILTIQGEDGTETLEGKVAVVSDAGLALKMRSSTRIIDINRILGFEEQARPKRKRVIKRYVRKIDEESDARQHLADRHGVLVSVLNAVDSETAREMHDKINHLDLGHQHGDKPQRGNVDTDTATQRLEDLDGAVAVIEDDLDDEE
jgi:hypothetical protein